MQDSLFLKKKKKKKVYQVGRGMLSTEYHCSFKRPVCCIHYKKKPVE